MAWIYLPRSCLSSQCAAELGASMKASDWPGRGQKLRVSWRGKSMRRRRWLTVWRKEPWTRLLSGTTLSPSTANRGVAKWIASLEDTPVNPSVSPARCGGKKTRDTSGPTSPESSKKSHPGCASSRMSRGIYSWDSAKSMMTFKQWAIQLRLACSRRRRWVRRTAGNASSFSLWPTPRALAGGQGSQQRLKQGENPSLNTAAQSWPWKTPTSTDGKGSSQPGQRVGQLSNQAEQFWPTVIVGDSLGARNKTSGRQPGSKHHDGETLSDKVLLWPTPDASLVTDTEDPESWLARMNARREESRVKYGTPLGVASRLWPTLVRQSKLVSRQGVVLASFLRCLPRSKSGSTYSRTPRGLRLLSRNPERNVNIRLNPNFAEWLMGWPIGWTDFVPLATGLFHFRQLMHSMFSGLVSAYQNARKKASAGMLIDRTLF